MRRESPLLRYVRRTAMVCSTGVLLQATGGCDPAVRALILGGFQDLTVSLVDAIFLRMTTGDELGTTGTTATGRPGFTTGTGAATGNTAGTGALGEAGSVTPPTLGSGAVGTGSP